MSPSYLFIVFIALCAFTSVYGDVYMQNPRGNNDRLNENGDRQNAQRLFDSENNARGGYCWGPELSYIEGSELSIEWTNQHSCGNDNTNCNIVLQYMCSDDSEGADQTRIIRDGTTTTTIPTSTNPADGTNYYNYKDPNVGDGTTFRYGMNEDIASYQACRARSRNQGLFTAEENVANNQGAMATRQNANGQRHGLECSEERDYYPYWHPSGWTDIAVLVNDKSECGYYQAESANVKAKNYCSGTTNAQKAANNERDCAAANGQWASVPALGKAAPICDEAPNNRDNHLGNGIDGTTNTFNWTLPKAADEDCITNGRCACVLRLRYNISVAEINDTTDSRLNGAKSPVEDDPNVEASGVNVTLAIDTAQTGRGFQDRSFMFRITPRPDGVSPSAKIYNLNVRGKRGNIVQTYPATEYDFVPTHIEAAKDDLVHIQWTGCDTNPAGNAGEGKTSTDRSNIVQIENMKVVYPLTEEEIKTTPNVLFKDPAVRLRMANIDQKNCLTYQQLLAANNNNQAAVEQDTRNCLVLNAAPTPRFTGGLVKLDEVGTYNFMSTRNNNFSNRSQKGSITVSESWPAWKTAAIVVGGVVAVAVGAAVGTIVYAKRNPHSRVAEVIGKIPGLNRI